MPAILVWLAFLSGVSIAAELSAPVVTELRTLESLPLLAWWMALAFSFTGWLIANFPTAVKALLNKDPVGMPRALGMRRPLYSRRARGR